MRTSKRFAEGILVSLALLLTGCGAGSGNDTEGADNGAAAAGGNFGNCTNASVLEAIDGLDIAARETKLEELRAEESDTIQVYGSIGADDIDSILQGFKAEYGVTVETFSANSEEVLQRLGQEQQAGRAQADLVENNGTELELATTQKLMAPITTPHADGLPDEVVYPTWIGNRYNVFTVLRNPDLVSEADAPRTYEDLADSKWDGKLGVEAGNWDLFATSVAYMQEEEGKSEEEALAIWKEIVSGAKVYTSNTPLAEAVESGELGLALTYNHYWARFVGRGSKSIEWEPAIEPQVLRPNGVGIPCEAPNPATAVLLFDYFISEEGQRILGDVAGRDVTSPNVEAGMLPGTDYEKFFMDLKAVIPSSDKWVPIYDEMIRNTG